VVFFWSADGLSEIMIGESFSDWLAEWLFIFGGANNCDSMSRVLLFVGTLFYVRVAIKSLIILLSS